MRSRHIKSSGWNYISTQSILSYVISGRLGPRIISRQCCGINMRTESDGATLKAEQRTLLIRRLHPPKQRATKSSYCEPAILRGGTLAGHVEGHIKGSISYHNMVQCGLLILHILVVTFSSRDTPQPFLNPAIMHQRMAQQKLKQVGSSRGIPK